MQGDADDRCPRCRRSASAPTRATDGPFMHHVRLGMHVDGRRLDARPCVHAFLGILMWADGSLTRDETIADMLQCSRRNVVGLIGVLVSHARNAFRALDMDPPFVRVRGKGLAWTGTGRGVVRTGETVAICPECGCNLRPETVVASGAFSHDPRTGRASVAGVVMRAPPQQHALLGALMRAAGDVVPHDVLADRIGSDSDQPSRAMRTLVSNLKATLRCYHVDLPVENVGRMGYRWTCTDEPCGEVQGPPAPGRLRLGRSDRPDLTAARSDVTDARHACGCMIGAPGLSAGPWTWREYEGIARSDSPFVLRGGKAEVLATLMAANGRCVHGSIHLGDVLGGDRDAGGRHLKVLMTQIRTALRSFGLEAPFHAVRGQGYAWDGPETELVIADPTRPCPTCTRRRDRAASVTDATTAYRPHPAGLSETTILFADLLRSNRGRSVRTRDALRMLGSDSDRKLLKTYAHRIRTAYRRAGRDDPLISERGVGYRWIGFPEDAVERPGTVMRHGPVTASVSSSSSISGAPH